MTLQITLVGGKGGARPSSLHTTREGPMEYVIQDGCKIYMNSYMASSRSCFMVTWTIFKNHLLEVGLSQNRETMALGMLTIIDLFYYIMNRFHRSSIWLRTWSHMSSHYTPGLCPHDMILEVCWDGLWTLTFGLSRYHGHVSWLMCEVALSQACQPTHPI
jgi:hypothetical protein